MLCLFVGGAIIYIYKEISDIKTLPTLIARSQSTLNYEQFIASIYIYAQTDVIYNLYLYLHSLRNHKVLENTRICSIIVSTKMKVIIPYYLLLFLLTLLLCPERCSLNSVVYPLQVDPVYRLKWLTWAKSGRLQLCKRDFIFLQSKKHCMPFPGKFETER